MKTDVARRTDTKRPPAAGPTVDLPQDDSAARALLKEAHGRMYRWPVGFEGYRAQVLVNDEGRLFGGQTIVHPRQETVVTLDADPPLQEWVRKRLWSQAIHLAWGNL